MRLYPSRFFALFAAAAIFIVGATCTQAGCLISLNSAPAAHPESRHSCCEHHRPESPAQKNDGKPCPLCQNPVVLAKAADKAAATVHFTIGPCLLMAQPTFVAQAIAPLSFAALAPEPPAPSPTLLSLHCALLT